jgi:prepilin signal peptidase PulO-like enzyme (type II secretory pathway)
MNMQMQKSDVYRNLAFIGAIVLLLLLGRFQFTLQFGMNLALILVFAVVSYVDWKTQRIPNILLLPLGVLALWLVVLDPSSAWMRLAGGLFAFVPFALTAVVRPGQLGGGDIKLATLLGLLFGFPNIVWALLIAVLGGGLVVLTMWLTQRAKRETQVPYAPFLCFGALVVLLVLPFYGF